MSASRVVPTSEVELMDLTVRELTDRFPATMPVLAELGIDLCCGGGHRVLKALVLHEADLDLVLPALMKIIEHEKASS